MALLLGAQVAAAAGCGNERAAPSPPAAPEAQSAEPARPAEPLKPAEPHDPASPPAPCGDAARCYALGSDAERDEQPARAAELFGHACDLELGQACFRLGAMLRDGPGLAADEARSAEFFTRGCRYGSQSACDALGH